MIIYYCLFSVLCGVASGIVAANKGRSGFTWFLIGTGFGIIGFILALVVKENTQKVEQKMVEDGHCRNCPFCAEVVKIEAKLCRFCGKDLPEIKKELPESSSHPLIDAVLDGNWVESKKLLNAGEDIEKKDQYGRTALDIALAKKDKLIANLIKSYM